MLDKDLDKYLFDNGDGNYKTDKEVKGKITKKDMEILNDRINELMYGDDDLEEEEELNAR